MQHNEQTSQLHVFIRNFNRATKGPFGRHPHSPAEQFFRLLERWNHISSDDRTIILNDESCNSLITQLIQQLINNTSTSADELYFKKELAEKLRDRVNDKMMPYHKMVEFLTNIFSRSTIQHFLNSADKPVKYLAEDLQNLFWFILQSQTYENYAQSLKREYGNPKASLRSPASKPTEAPPPLPSKPAPSAAPAEQMHVAKTAADLHKPAPPLPTESPPLPPTMAPEILAEKALKSETLNKLKKANDANDIDEVSRLYILSEELFLLAPTFHTIKHLNDNGTNIYIDFTWKIFHLTSIVPTLDKTSELGDECAKFIKDCAPELNKLIFSVFDEKADGEKALQAFIDRAQLSINDLKSPLMYDLALGLITAAAVLIGVVLVGAILTALSGGALTFPYIASFCAYAGITTGATTAGVLSFFVKPAEKAVYAQIETMRKGVSDAAANLIPRVRSVG